MTEPSDFDHHDALADQRRRNLPDLPGFGPPTPTPRFVRVAMGLAPGPTPHLHATNPPIRRRGKTLAPRPTEPPTAGQPAEPTIEPTADQPAEQPRTPTVSQPPTVQPAANRPARQPQPAAPAVPAANQPLSQTDQARLARGVVAAVVAVPVWLLVLLIVAGLALGPSETAPVVVNDRPSCDPASVQTIDPDQLAASDWWNDC